MLGRSLLRPLVPLAPLARPTALSLRASSTVSRPAPSDAAASLISALPGSSMAAKTGFFTVAAALAATLISKEFYVINVEFFESIAHFGAFYIWYATTKDAVIEHLEDKRSRFINVLTDARSDHKAVVQERIDHIKQMGDVVGVTKNLYAMSKEIATLESQIYTQRQQQQQAADVKSTLDAWVRYEASVREREQKDLVRSVVEKIEKKVREPRFQDAYFGQCLDEIERIGKRV